MTSIKALLATVTADQARAMFVATAESVGVPASKWRKGGVASTILTIVAITYAAFSSVMVQAISAGFLETATGGWLRLIATYIYGVDAIAATSASGELTLTNAGGGIYDYAAGEFVVLNSTTKQTYANEAPLHIGALATVTGVVFVCTVAGAVGTAAPGQIDTLVTQALGVTCTNPDSVVGLDAELDADLRARCINKLASLSVRGVRNAYVWAATTALRLDGTPVNINRVQVSESSSTGIVDVWLASPSGTPDPADLTAIAAFVEANVRPMCVTVNLHACTSVPYSAVLTVWAQAAAGLAQGDVEEFAADALTAYVASYPISGLKKPPSGLGYLYATGVEGAVKAANPAIFAVDGATDLALNGGQVAADAVTINVRLVNP